MRIAILICSFLLAISGNSQVSFTFEVDMNNETVSPSGVHVMGNFQDPDGAGPLQNPLLIQWDPSAYVLTDPDLDGVYSITMSLVPAVYEFKFINGNSLAEAESVPEACTVNMIGNNNRHTLVDVNHLNYSVCYGRCAACGVKSARIRINMSTVDVNGDGVFGEPGQDIHPTGVFVSGDFQNPNGASGDWNPAINPMYDWDGDYIYEATVSIGTMSQIAFNIHNGNDWAYPHEYISGSCGDGADNRLEQTPLMDNVFPAYCWNLCNPCGSQVNVTFQVNTNNECVDLSDGVYILGLGTVSNPEIAMSDLDGDGIWTVTIPLYAGHYNYNFRIGSSYSETLNYYGRSINLDGFSDVTIPIVCFGTNSNCGTLIPPSDVTFKVQANSEEIPEGHAVWLMGNFSDPVWQAGAIQMSLDNSSGLWTVTLSQVCTQILHYKFAIGISNTNISSNWQEEDSYFGYSDGCQSAYYYQAVERTYARTSVDPVELCFQYNSCQPCSIVYGCTDTAACNYSTNVISNPSLCHYPGCDDPTACNYNPNSCGGLNCMYPGCNDPAACNYTPDTCDDGSCIYPEQSGDTDCSGNVDETDVFNLIEVFGCMEGCDLYDFDNDGIVGVSDIYILMSLIGL